MKQQGIVEFYWKHYLTEPLVAFFPAQHKRERNKKKSLRQLHAHLFAFFLKKKTGEQRVNQMSTFKSELSGLGELTEADKLLELRGRQ